jgi:hypothetical protein
MQAGRIPDDGFLLLASVPYDEIGVDRARAELKSRFLSRFAADVIRAEFPRLGEQMSIRTAVLDWRSRTLEAIALATERSRPPWPRRHPGREPAPARAVADRHHRGRAVIALRTAPPAGHVPLVHA